MCSGDAAARVRRRVLRLKQKGHTLVAIAALVKRSRRRVLQILAEERARYDARHARDAS
jgi:hypothetical protein